MNEIIKLNDSQLKYVLAQLFADDEKAAEELVDAAREAAKSQKSLIIVAEEVVHGRGVSC